jgi:hypothetical protein
LTPQGTDGRSNRQRFTDEEKRAMVREKEKPGRWRLLAAAWHRYQPVLPRV